MHSVPEAVLLSMITSLMLTAVPKAALKSSLASDMSLEENDLTPLTFTCALFRKIV